MSGGAPEKPDKPKVKKVVKKVESRKRELDSDSSNTSGPRYRSCGAGNLSVR